MRGAVKFAAWKGGAWVRIARIDGSLFEPVVFTGTHWGIQSRTGATTRMQFDRAEVEFDWWQLFRRGSSPWLERLRVDGVMGKINLPLEEPTPPKRLRRSWFAWSPAAKPWLPLPPVIEAHGLRFIFQSAQDYVRIEGGHIMASENAPGEISAERVTIRQPWLARTFVDVRGTTALLGSELHLGGIVLAPGVEIRSLVAEMSDFARGRLNLKLVVDAFEGELQAKSATTPRDDRLRFSAGGSFTGINIAQLAAFLGVTEPAGGTIKDGTFSFRGSPHDPARATARLRLEATNFQWDERQWDSLLAGMELVNGRLQVPEFQLRQGANTLNLTGDLVLPGPKRKWWKGEFSGRVKARIDNLTELSALFLPEFKYVAGKVEVDGHVSGRGEELNGQLLVAGTDLTWRNAPIELLHAALKLEGKELRVSRIELVNGDDYLRGSGVISIFGPFHYSGDIRIAVEDLADYEAFLQKPVFPEPLAGGAIIDWRGSAVAGQHTGKYLARLRKVRARGEIGRSLHPINAELEAAYKPGSMEFTRFALSDDDSSLVANVAIRDRTVQLSKIKLEQDGSVRMEGDAVLPLDLWQQWPNVSLAQLLIEDVPAQVKLTFHELDLGAAMQLSGWKFPVAGMIDGSLIADGILPELKLGGGLTIEDGLFPIDAREHSIEDVNAVLRFEENTVELTRFEAHHALGNIELSGTAQLNGLQPPLLALTARSPHFTMLLYPNGEGPRVSTVSQLELQIEGAATAATVRGQASILNVSLEWLPDLTRLWNPGSRLEFPWPFQIEGGPFRDWHLSIACATDPPDGLREGTHFARVAGTIEGTGRRPAFIGEAAFEDVDVTSGQATTSADSDDADDAVSTVNLRSALLTFPAHSPRQPSLLLEVSGSYLETPFSAVALGPINHLMRIYESRPPLTDASVHDFLAGTPPPLRPSFRSKCVRPSPRM